MPVSGATYTEVHYQAAGSPRGPCSQICGSLCISLFGLCVFFGSLWMIAYNEQSNVCTQRALASALREVTPIGCESKQAEHYEGKLVHFSCGVSDKSLKVMSPGDFSGAGWLKGAFSVEALKVKQDVSMFQCKERHHRREEKTGDGKQVKVIESWTYEQGWSSHPVYSSNFKAYSNSAARKALAEGCGDDFKGNPSFPMKAETKSSASLIAGAYDLTRFLGKISVTAPIKLTPGDYYPPSRVAVHKEKRIANDGVAYTYSEFVDYFKKSADEMWASAKKEKSYWSSPVASVSGNTVQTCPGIPNIGCLRISYYKSSATRVSHLAQVSSGSSWSGYKTQAWVAPKSWMCSKSASAARVDLFAEGWKKASGMIDRAVTENLAGTWFLRIVSIFLAVFGIHCFFQPIQTVANLVDQFFDWFKGIPLLGWLLDFFGNVVAGAVGYAITFISLGIGIPSSLTVLAITWLFMRPHIGIPLLMVCIVVIALTVKAMIHFAKDGRSKRQKAE